MPAKYTPEQQVAAFLEKVQVGGPDECWPWLRYIRKDGYGDTGRTLAYRVSYELFVGPIPEGLTLDHTCHDPAVCRLGNECPHRRCVNPRHLVAVPHKINAGRTVPKETCPAGHEYTPENRVPARGGKTYICRICRNKDALRRYYARKQ